MMEKLKTYMVHWTESKDFKLEVKARDEAHAEEVFEKMYSEDYEKKVKPEADFYDGSYEVFDVEEEE